MKQERARFSRERRSAPILLGQGRVYTQREIESLRTSFSEKLIPLLLDNVKLAPVGCHMRSNKKHSVNIGWMFFAYTLLRGKTPKSFFVSYKLRVLDVDADLYCYSCPLCTNLKLSSCTQSEKGQASMKECSQKFGRHFNIKHSKIVRGTAKSVPKLDVNLFAMASV